MKIRKSSLIWLVAMYATLALTLPYEWRVGPLQIMFSTSYAAVVVIIVYILCQIRSKMMFMWILYNGALLFSTYLNNIDLKEQITLSLMGIALVASYELINYYGSKRQFGIYVFYYALLVIINSLQTIYFGSSRSMDGYLCIFGNKNWYLYRILPAIFLLIAYCGKYAMPVLSFKLSGLIALSLLSVLIAGSGAGMLVLGLWGVYIILLPFIKRIKQHNGFDNYFIYSSIIIFVFFTIVVWKATEIFAPIIVGLLGKDLTFTTRTRIWDRTLELIAEKPLLGYGALPGNEMVKLFYGVPDFTTTHNQYLGEIFRGGIPLLIIFIVMIYLVFKNIQKTQNMDIRKTMTFGVFCLLLWWMMESITSMYLILVLFTCYHAEDVDRSEEEWWWNQYGGD